MLVYLSSGGAIVTICAACLQGVLITDKLGSPGNCNYVLIPKQICCVGSNEQAV